MASTDKLMRARTKFKVVNNVSTRFKLTQHTDMSGMHYGLPCNGTFDISLDITTYPGWKGELRAAFVNPQDPQTAYAEFFLMPWHGYDLSRLYNFELYITSCKMTYTANYTENGNYYTANVQNQEIMEYPGYLLEDLRDLQQRIGDVARPRNGLVLFAGGGSKVYQLGQNSTSTELPVFKDTFDHPEYEKIVTPVGLWDGSRHSGDSSPQSSFILVSSVTFETLG